MLLGPLAMPSATTTSSSSTSSSSSSSSGGAATTTTSGSLSVALPLSCAPGSTPLASPSESYRRLVVESLSRSFSAGSLSRSFVGSLTSLSRTDDFFEAIYNSHLGARSPAGIISPTHDLAHFAGLEDQFCKNFFCCGAQLKDLHDLLQHFEENHVQVESDDGIDGDADDLPFEFESADEMDTDMSDCGAIGFSNDSAMSFADIQFRFPAHHLKRSGSNASSASAIRAAAAATANASAAASIGMGIGRPATPGAAPTAGSPSAHSVALSDIYSDARPLTRTSSQRSAAAAAGGGCSSASSAGTPVPGSPVVGMVAGAGVGSSVGPGASLSAFETSVVRKRTLGHSSSSSKVRRQKGTSHASSASTAAAVAAGGAPSNITSHASGALGHNSFAHNGSSATIPFNFEGPTQVVGDLMSVDDPMAVDAAFVATRFDPSTCIFSGIVSANNAASAPSATAASAAVATVADAVAAATSLAATGLSTPSTLSMMELSSATHAMSMNGDTFTIASDITSQFQSKSQISSSPKHSIVNQRRSSKSLFTPPGSSASSPLSSTPVSSSRLAATTSTSAAAFTGQFSTLTTSASPESWASSMSGDNGTLVTTENLSGMSNSASTDAHVASKPSLMSATPHQSQDPTQSPTPSELTAPGFDMNTIPAVPSSPEDDSSSQSAKDDRPYKCKMPDCSKAYKNPGGLKYHMQHGHWEDTGDPEMNNIIHKPYQCTVTECGKRYKNLNGLKYHIEHAHISILNEQ